MGKLIHIGFNETLKFKHHSRAALRVRRRPVRLRGKCRLNGTLKHSGITKPDPRLHSARVGIKHITRSLRDDARTIG